MPSDRVARAQVRMEEIACVQYVAEAFRGLARQVFFTPADRRAAAAVGAGRAKVQRATPSSGSSAPPAYTDPP